ncbi:hypothetical protein [Nocardia tengchongensis]|uniref:hypothetical protein n=1 Tax=Nocardia tengchongensis TaxID=2055889 RepID=UPI0036AD265B
MTDQDPHTASNWWWIQRRTVPGVRSADSAAPQPQTTQAPAPAPAANEPAQEPDKKPDRDRLKTVTAVIAACALVATVASAVAAWESWRTAAAVEKLGRDTFAVSEPKITIANIFRGWPYECATNPDGTAKPDGTFTGWVQVRNEGHVDGHLELRTGFIGIQPTGPELFADGSSATATVPALTENTYEIRIACRVMNMRNRHVQVDWSIGGLPSTTVHIDDKNVSLLCTAPGELAAQVRGCY